MGLAIRARLNRADYSVVIGILVIVAIAGYLPGVIAGVFACVVLFLINYSGVNVVKHVLTGADQRSNVDRPAAHEQILREAAPRLIILKLQGYMFFGTANTLLNPARERVDGPGPPLRFLVLDFKQVTGIDSSATISFVKMRQLAERQGFTLVMTQVARDIRQPLEREGFDRDRPNVFRFHHDLDHGLEACENTLLRETQADFGAANARGPLDAAFPEPGERERLMTYFERGLSFRDRLLTVKSSLGVMLGRHPHLPDVAHLFDTAWAMKWLPGVAFGAALLNAAHRSKHRLVIPGVILGSVALIFAELFTRDSLF